ncbi:fibronectin type III domain-containing protein [uncultured Phycicoccus sp.]|uniref:fibronectin type III domain-containing protein n=1 Tax=uncultured Phycicoccus sp. TaxID=661422 RepID=UPI002605471B|nr:fibronectin type III domain-containing protein [uncultured Phycicoccus sp.]
MPFPLPARAARVRLTRALRPVLAVLLVALGLVIPATAAHANTPGGATRTTAVPLPVADLDSSFVASNAHMTTPRGTDGQSWNNVAWYSWVPAETVSVYMRATSLSPGGWDNTLEVWRSGSLVTQNDDSYGLDAALRVTLQAGVRYEIGLGGFSTYSRGTVNLTFSTRVPSAPRAVAAQAQDGAAALSWTAPSDTAGGVTSYTVSCGPVGDARSDCGSVRGTPPVTSMDVVGLRNGTEYEFVVTAENILGSSPASDAVTATPLAVTSTTVTIEPAEPTSGEPFALRVAVSGVTGGTVHLTFDGVAHTLRLGDDGTDVLTDIVRGVGSYAYAAEYAGTRGTAPSAASGDVVVAKRAQTVTVGALPEDLVYAGTPVELSATSSAGLPVTFAADGACVVRDGTMLHLVDVGTCTVTGRSAGDEETLAGEGVATAEVGKRSQSLVLAPLPPLVYGQDPVQLTAASSVGLPVALTGDGACTVENGLLTVTDVGGCTVTAAQPGDDHTAAAESVVGTEEVALRDQVVSIDAFDAPTLGAPTTGVTGSSEFDLPVTLAASGACAFDGDELVALAAGPCVVTADADGDRLTNPGSASRTVEIADVDTDVAAGIDASIGDRVAGAPVSAVGSGLQPGSTLTLTVRSTPQILGTVEVAADGTARIDAVLPRTLESGEHRLIADGNAFDGGAVQGVLRFGLGRDGTFVLLGDERAVTALPVVPVALAATGVSGALQALATLALLAIGLGVGLVLVRGRLERLSA